MTSRQFAEWIAYSKIEPFGERNRDFSLGILGSFYANVNRDREKKPDPFSPEDFMIPAYKPAKTGANLVDSKRMLIDAFKISYASKENFDKKKSRSKKKKRGK